MGGGFVFYRKDATAQRGVRDVRGIGGVRDGKGRKGVNTSISPANSQNPIAKHVTV